MTPRVHVLAVLGTSPAVLTELAWWLVTQERAEIVAFEVWTTGPDTVDRSGAQALARELAAGLWEGLAAAVGRAVPRPDVHLFGGAAPLSDIRTPEDAAVVVATLHDRVQELRRTLPFDVRLEGSLAGGRKTMSAALQTAFELQARRDDRLSHVLLHPSIEGDRDTFNAFRVPTAALSARLGVPEAEQLRVYDVPYTNVRTFVRDPALRRALDHEPYEKLWPRLRSGVTAATVSRRKLEVTPAGAEPFTVSLSPAAAELYAALVTLGPGWHAAEAVGRAIEGLQWTKERSATQRSDWDGDADAVDVAKNRLAQRKRDLKRQLEELARQGLDALIPERRKDGDFRLPDAALVMVDAARVAPSS